MTTGNQYMYQATRSLTVDTSWKMITTDGNVTMIVIYWSNNDLYIYRWTTVII